MQLRPRLIATVLLAASLVCPAAAFAGEKEASADRAQLKALLRFYSAAATRRTLEVLELLQIGKTTEAIAILEAHVLGPALADMRIEGGPVTDSTVVYTLLKAREYRGKYPRTHSDPEIEAEIKSALSQPIQLPAKLSE